MIHTNSSADYEFLQSPFWLAILLNAMRGCGLQGLIKIMRLIIFFTDITLFIVFVLSVYGAIQAVKKVRNDVQRRGGNSDNE